MGKHSGDGKNTAVYIQTDERKCLLWNLLAAWTATDFYKGLWFLKQSYLLDFQNRRNTQQAVITDPLSIQPVSLWISTVYTKCRGTSWNWSTDNQWHKQGARPKGTQDIRLSQVSHIACRSILKHVYYGSAHFIWLLLDLIIRTQQRLEEQV